MSVRTLRLLITFILIAGPARGVWAQPGESCADATVVRISGATSEQQGEICRAAVDAFAFLAQFGLLPRRTIRLELVESPLEIEGHPIYGSYDYRADRVQIMSLPAIRRTVTAPVLHDQPLDDAQYRGFVAHELSHAVAHHNTRLDRVSNAAQEYLAYATQLAVLPPARREQFITAAEVGPWELNDVISEAYMAFAPNRFAVKSYLHLTRLAQPNAFVQQLLNHRWRYVPVTAQAKDQ